MINGLNYLLGKKVTFKGKDYSIEDVTNGTSKYNVEVVCFKLKLVKGRDSSVYTIPTTHFESGFASTKDEELNSFIKDANEKFHELLNIALKNEEEKKQQEELVKYQRILKEAEEKKIYLRQQKELGSKQGKEDARNKVSTLYKIFTSYDYKSITKASIYTNEFKQEYISAYEEEKKAIKLESLIRVRALQDTLDNYPGDLDELLEWMHKNILRIDVFAPTDKIENEQMAINALNERDGTSYQVKIRSGQYIAYEAFFKNPSTAPKEFLTWKVSKHDFTTSDLSKRVMDYPMNARTGKMTCNALVKELLYNSEYAFHLGKVA